MDLLDYLIEEFWLLFGWLISAILTTYNIIKAYKDLKSVSWLARRTPIALFISFIDRLIVNPLERLLDGAMPRIINLQNKILEFVISIRDILREFRNRRI